METIDIIFSLSKEKGISITSICNLLGLNAGYLNNVKNGKAKLTDDRIEKIADFLGTTTDYLQGKTDKKNKPTVVLTTKQQQVLDVIDKLPDEAIEPLLCFAESIANSLKSE